MLGKGLYTLYPCIYVEMDKEGVFLTTAVLPLAIKYTVIAKWISLADRVAGLGGLTLKHNGRWGWGIYGLNGWGVL